MARHSTQLALTDVEPAHARRSSIPAYAWAVLAAALVVLVAHIARYWFLTDDAYISFRYARNLADGHGLVFNPGFEPVEGYTNFLWVLMLAALAALGLPPESTANVLSMTAGVLLWAIVTRFALRERRADRPVIFALAAPVLLAVTRSYAVWCTSGLETKLFELLVVAGVLRAVTELRHARDERRAFPVSALLFALATLTRPDALLIAFCVLAVQTLLIWRAGSLRISRTALAFFAYVAIVGAHVLWRRAYYGDWLPNTFYAKTGGGQWWSLGAQYVAFWFVEYAGVLWIPLLVAAVIDRIRQRRADVPLLFAAAIGPHMLYLMSIGGDHFEYRPLDVYFPLIYLLLGDGAAAIAANGRRARFALAYLSAVLIGVVALPEASHAAYPRRYIVGFPGVHGRLSGEHEFLTPESNPWLMRVPLIREYARLFNRLARATTRQFAAIRQEEHRLFLATVIPEGRTLARLVREGRLPADLHVAIDSVGAIPYYSNLRTLDRLGLTDRHVARSGVRATDHDRMIAHDVHATTEYAADAGVDVWAAHDVHLLFAQSDPDVFRAAIRAAELPASAVRYVKFDPDHLFVGIFPDGDRPSARIARLEWRPLTALLADTDYVRRFKSSVSDRLADQPDDAPTHHLLGLVNMQLGDPGAAEQNFRTALRLDPDAREPAFDLGSLYLHAGRPDLALPHFRRVLDIGPPTPEAWNAVGRCNVMIGKVDDAIAAFEAAVRLNANYADAHGNLANILASTGRVDDAKSHYETAIRLAPDAPLTHQNLSIVLERAGDETGAIHALRRGVQFCPDDAALAARLALLLASSPDDSLRNGTAALELAERAVELTQRQDPQALEALAAAFAEVGRFDDAERTADEAIRLCTSTGNASLQQRLQQQRSAYVNKTPFRRQRADP